MNNGLLPLKANTIPFLPFLLLHSNTTRHSLFSIQHPKLEFHVKLPSVFSSKTPTGTETFDSADEFHVEDEEEEITVPLRQWTRNKPRGFGEGKVYDTSLEDKLLQELDHTSRAAQLANINNLNNNPQLQDGNPNPNKHKEVFSSVVPNGIRVRLVNLPKKKNIHRDLQAAFKPFTGIIDIIPVVSGNQKTRDPVCKGFAFVHFKSEKEAKRFVDIFSTQPVTFGKVQKQIRCEIMKPSPSPNPASVINKVESPLPALNATMAVNSNLVTETPLDPYVEDAAAFDILKIGNSFHNVVQEKHEPEASSESKKVREKGKKTAMAKKKLENTPKPNIPGSANRLKMKEKALLSGVFSKYGGKSSG